MTTPTGSTYTVTQLSPPAGLENWRIVVPGTTEIDGRRFTVRSLQSTTPETSPGHSLHQHGPGRPGHRGGTSPSPPGRRCGSAWSPARCSAGKPAAGRSWCCATAARAGRRCPPPPTASWSAARPRASPPSSWATRPPAPAAAAGEAGAEDTPSGPNAAPEAAQPLPPRTVPAGATSEPLDLTPYFDDPDGDPLTFAAVSDDASVAIADLPRGSNWLTLRGVAAGEAVVVVTARDPGGGARQPVHDGDGADGSRARGGAARFRRGPCWPARRASRWT